MLSTLTKQHVSCEREKVGIVESVVGPINVKVSYPTVLSQLADETSGVTAHGEVVVGPRRAAGTIMATINEPWRARRHLSPKYHRD